MNQFQNEEAMQVNDRVVYSSHISACKNGNFVIYVLFIVQD